MYRAKAGMANSPKVGENGRSVCRDLHKNVQSTVALSSADPCSNFPKSELVGTIHKARREDPEVAEDANAAIRNAAL